MEKSRRQDCPHPVQHCPTQKCTESAHGDHEETDRKTGEGGFRWSEDTGSVNYATWLVPSH